MARGPYRYDSESESESESDRREGTVISDSEVERERERNRRRGGGGGYGVNVAPPAKTRVVHNRGRDVIVISSDEDEEEIVEPAKRRHSGAICLLDDDVDDQDVENILVVPSSQPEEIEIDFFEPIHEAKRQPSIVTARKLVSEVDSPTTREWTEDHDDAILEVNITKQSRKPIRKNVVGDASPSKSAAPRGLLSPSPTDASTPSPAKSPRKKKANPVLDRRMAMANALFDELNATVFSNGLTGVEITWNARFLTTAGRAKWRKSSEGVHSSILELSPKVIDSDDRLRNTVAHEMCHLASWMLDKVPTEQHGRLWTAWTNKVMRVRPDIKISARHEYEITYKFNWKCSQCNNVFGRHTKSINVEEKVCPCSGRLIALFDENPRARKTVAASRLAAAQPQGSPTSRLREDTAPLTDTPTKKPSRRNKPYEDEDDLDEDIVQLVKALASSQL